MRRSRRFRPRGWEALEGRSLLSAAGGVSAPSPDVPVSRTDPYSEARLAINLQQVARGGAGNIVFLGDSLTDLWTGVGAASWTSQMVPRGAVDFGITGNTTGNLLSQIAAGELAGRPKVVVLMIGTNNIVQGDNAQQVAQGIAADVGAIRAASPQSHVLVMSLLPIKGGTNTPWTSETMWVNAMIAKLDDGSHVHVVNTSSTYLLPGGSINGGLFLDNVHPNAQGFALWGSQITGILDVLTGHAAPAPPSTPLTPPPAPPPTLPPRHRRRR